MFNFSLTKIGIVYHIHPISYKENEMVDNLDSFIDSATAYMAGFCLKN